MEVTAEIYAWLINLNIVDGNKSIKMKKDGEIILTEKITEKLLQGTSYMSKIIINLEDGYNKFYKINLKYTEKLKDLKIPNNAEDGADITSNSVKYHNWKIISDILMNFGIEIEEENITKLISGNKQILSDLLTTIYTLTSELIKRSTDQSKYSNNTSITQDNSLFSIRKIFNSNFKDTNNSNSILNTTGTESIDLKNIDLKKDYTRCESPLEFFILSLSKNLGMMPRQSVALLSNNRKYLIHICNKGIKGNYEKILNWYDDLSINSRSLTSVLRRSKDGKPVAFAILSCGFYSKNYHIALNAYNLVNQIQGDFGGDWDWFIKEGLDAMIYSINRHSGSRTHILNLFLEFGKNRIKELIKTIHERLTAKTNDNGRLLEFLGSVVTHVKQCDILIYSEIKTFLIDTCLTEVFDKSSSISILSDALVYFNPIEKHTLNTILNYMKKVFKGDKKNIKVVCTGHYFRLLKYFGDIKDEIGPTIYKTLVYLFLENYDDHNLRENILLQFTSFFKSNTNIPINILLDPYMRQLKATQNYDLNDFQFLTHMIEHPRLEVYSIKEILDFIFYISLTNLNYSRVANLFVHLLFDKNLIHPEEHYPSCVTYIKNSLNLFIGSIKKKRTKKQETELILLETPYDLISMNIAEINDDVHTDVVEAVNYHRGELNFHSSGLLALLFNFDNHDDVLLALEEKYAERYEPVEVNNERVLYKKEQDYKQSAEYTLEKIKKKKKEEEMALKEQENKIKMRDKRIKNILSKKYERINSSNSKINNTNTTINNSNRNTTIIVNEGSFISDNDSVFIKNKENLKNSIIPILLQDEEDRELTAINGLIKQYARNIKFYFNSYLTEVNNTITKANFLKLYRDLKIGNELLPLENLSIAIKNIFGLPLNCFSKEQFITLNIQISYLIFYKLNNKLTISKCFECFLQLLLIPNEKTKNKEMKETLDFLNKKFIENKTTDIEAETIENKLEKVKTARDLPPGFKKVIKTSVDYNFIVPRKFLEFMPISKIVSLELLDEIIYKITNSHVLESLVNVTNKSEVVFDNSKPNYKKWSKQIIYSYTLLDQDQGEIGKEIANLIEDMITALDKGRISLEKIKFISPMEKLEMESLNEYLKEKEKNDKKRTLRCQIIKKELIEKKELKDEEKRKREEDINKLKLEKEEKLKKQLLIEREIRSKMKNEIKQFKLKNEEEKSNVEKIEKEKKEDITRKKSEEKKLFFMKQHRKLKEQLTNIKNIKVEIDKKQEEMVMAVKNLPKVNIRKVLDKKKNYIEFERNLNKVMEDLLKKNEFAELLSKYENHIKTIYEIYNKIGGKKISNSFIEDVMYINEFKEFLLNFTVLGLLINNEQMTYIFRKISRRNEDEKEEHMFFKYSDFMLSILYISIFGKFTSKSRNIMPSDIDNTNSNTVKSFFDFLGLELPFNKKDLENFINDRRALSAKQLSKLQLQVKKEKVGFIKNERKEIQKSNSQPKLGRKKIVENKRKEEQKETNKIISQTKANSRVVDSNIYMNNMKSNLNVLSPSGKPENWELKK